MLKKSNKSLLKALLIVAAGLVCPTIGCSNEQTVLNQQHSLQDNKWYYTDKIAFHANITDPKTRYTTQLCIRHDGTYKYSNLHVKVTALSPTNISKTYTYDYPLATKEGLWLGSHASNLYSLRLDLKDLKMFDHKGVWQFSVQHNMRDDILLGICNVGLLIFKDAAK